MRYRKQLEEMARSWCSLTKQEPTDEILNAFVSGGKLALENRDCIVNEEKEKQELDEEIIRLSHEVDTDNEMNDCGDANEY